MVHVAHTMLLAIDTSSDDSGIALYDQQRVLAECAWHSGRRHAEQVLPLIDLLLHNLDATPDDLSAVAVATGPGSWSGLRVGMSLAKSLVLAQQVPLLGLPTLDVLAYPQRHRAATVVPLVRLGRDRYGAAPYAQIEHGWQRTGVFRNLALQELLLFGAGAFFCGEVDEAARALLEKQGYAYATGAENVRRPAALAELAWQRLKAGEADDVVALEPIYLGSPVKEPQHRTKTEH